MSQKQNENTPSTELTPAYQEMDHRDENQIISEMRGEILEDLVYDIQIGNKRVTNLSYAGIKEAIRRRGSIEILDVTTEETEFTLRGLVKVRDLQNRIDVLGASEADKTKPFAYTLAINKAERNAFAKLIPAKWFATLIDEYLQQKGLQKRNQKENFIPQPEKPIVSAQTVKHMELNPEILTQLTATAPLQTEGLKQYPITEGLNQIGIINNYGEFTGIVPESSNLRRDNPAFTNFLFPRVLDQLCNKHQLMYEPVGTTNGELLYIIIKGKLAEAQIKELKTAVRWAFLKASGTNGNESTPT
jgi:hypothetical protein